MQVAGGRWHRRGGTILDRKRDGRRASAGAGVGETDGGDAREEGIGVDKRGSQGRRWGMIPAGEATLFRDAV